MREHFFQLIEAVMEKNSLRGNSCTITDFVLFCGTADHMRSFFPRNGPFQISVVFLTIHDALLTARGQRIFFVSNAFF